MGGKEGENQGPDAVQGNQQPRGAPGDARPGRPRRHRDPLAQHDPAAALTIVNGLMARDFAYLPVVQKPIAPTMIDRFARANSFLKEGLAEG